MRDILINETYFRYLFAKFSAHSQKLVKEKKKKKSTENLENPNSKESPKIL